MSAVGKKPGSEEERRVRHERRADVARLTARISCLATALDRLPHPILMVIAGQPLRVWHANAAARRRFGGDSLLKLCDDILVIPGGACGIHLLNGIRRAMLQGPACPQIVELTDQPGGRISARVYIEAVEVDTDAGLPVSRVLLLEVDERAATKAAVRRLCSEFGLTPREAEVALSLHACGSAHDLARAAGRSIHTVRAQLKAAMQKTCTHTQAGLVALVGSHLDGC